MVVEADECDGTFIRMPTEIGIVTNIDPEHLDYFGTVENMHREFEAFFRNIPFYGLAVTCIDHPVVAAMIERLESAPRRPPPADLRHHGQGADLVLEGIARRRRSHDVRRRARRAREGRRARASKGWRMPMPGQHNALNALAAIAVAAEAGIPDEVIRGALASFSGVKRRFQLTGTWNGVAIYDDYGHHPAEIAAVLEAARAGREGPRHRRGRAASLYARARSVRRVRACFRDADSVIVAPLYSAGEAPIDGIDARTLAEAIRNRGHTAVIAVDSPREVAPILRRHVRAGDMVICFGAGNSTEWAHALPEGLAEEPLRAGGVR